MRKRVFLKAILICTVCCLCACSNDESEFAVFQDRETYSEQMSKSVQDAISTQDSIIMQDSTIVPIEGNRDSILSLKRRMKTRANSSYNNDYQLLQEELRQLNEIPIYLEVQGNSNERRFLASAGKGRELTVEKFNGNSVKQKFYLKILPATSGIPYLIYSSETTLQLGWGHTNRIQM